MRLIAALLTADGIENTEEELARKAQDGIAKGLALGPAPLENSERSDSPPTGLSHQPFRPPPCTCVSACSAAHSAKMISQTCSSP